MVEIKTFTKRKVFPHILKLLKEDYVKGSRIVDLCRKYDLSETTISKYMVREGVKVNRNTPKLLKSLTEEDKAYIAGIIDGEGCIGICKRKDRCKTFGNGFYLTVRVRNTNHKLMDWLIDKTGLCSVLLTNREKTVTCKDNWEWKVHSGQAEQVIKQVGKYLIIKKKQAEVALKFIETKIINYGQYDKDQIGIPFEIWQQQLDCYKEMKKLNKRGKVRLDEPI